MVYKALGGTLTPTCFAVYPAKKASFADSHTGGERSQRNAIHRYADEKQRPRPWSGPSGNILNSVSG